MTPQPVTGFRHFETHHCVTGSLRHVYAFNGHPISEDLLLGLGEGVGFMYWHQKGQPPFIGGRAQPDPSMEAIAGQRTGVQVTLHHTASAAKAEKALFALLEAGQPVMLQVDMGFLPYFDFGGQEYHFGSHVVVACGYDQTTGEVLIADRDEALHPVPLAKLAQARGSQHKPFPPLNRWYTFDFSGKRTPTAAEIFAAIDHQAAFMLNPPISNMGVKGIAKAGRLIPTWAEALAPHDLRMALFNAYIFISPVGGSGGGCFRYMLSRFLAEAAVLTGIPALDESAAAFRHIADLWAQLGGWFKAASETPEPRHVLGECAPQLETLASLEQDAWHRLHEGVRAQMLVV